MITVVQGLVLRENDYHESDRLLDVLTKTQGLMTLSARGIRRRTSPLKSACQLFAYAEFTVLNQNGKDIITEASPIELFPAIREDLELLSLASYFSQAVAAAAQQDAADPQLLSLMLNSFYALTVLQKEQLLVKAAFELRLACLAGFTPQLDCCPVCGLQDPDRFLITQAEVICSTCTDPTAEGIRLPVSASVLAAMRYLCTCPASKLFSFRLPENELKTLSNLTETYLMAQFERGFSTLDFYKSLFLTSWNS